MTEVSFTAKVDLIIGGRACPPSLHARLARGETAEPGRVTRFFLGAWMGAGSREFSLSPIAPDGTATVRLRLNNLRMVGAYGARSADISIQISAAATICFFWGGGAIPYHPPRELVSAGASGSATVQ